jgi:glucokinase-like ROK family protein
MHQNGSYEKTDQTFLKNYNIKKVLNILRYSESLSRVELAALSCLDKKTITNIVNEQVASGQIRAVSRVSDGYGRPREMMALNGDYCYCLGVDLGGTHISGVITNFRGEIMHSKNVDLHSEVEPDTLIKLCYFVIDHLLKMANMQISDISGIGASIPGFLDKASGVSLISVNFPKWSNVPIRKVLKDKYGDDTDVYIDSNAIALAERWYGAGKDCSDFLVIDLGLGIGCGIVLDDKVFTGATGKSGEIGHTTVESDGPLCTCGRRGCIESLASGWALSSQASALMQQTKDTLLHSIILKGVKPSTKDIVLAAEMDDPHCRLLLEKAGEYIGIGIANAISLFNPSKVIIGGRLIEDNPVLMGKMQQTVESQTIPAIYDDTQIILSSLGRYASALGAATLCLEKHY